MMDNNKIEEIQDLEIALSTAIEHGDLIEDQLIEANRQLNLEIQKRIETEENLRTLIELLKTQKDDLEILVDSIITHSDDNDMNWIKQLENIEKETNTDPLTQVGNRRKFDSYISTEWQRAFRNQHLIALILIDIDMFKAYNDTYGHVKGDECLAKIARTIQQQISRPADVVCRYGGEEFIVILPETDLDGALKIARQISLSVEQLQIPHKKSRISDYVTVSIGVDSILPKQQSEYMLFVEHVDNLLYEAKQSGRNSIIGPDQTPQIRPREIVDYCGFSCEEEDRQIEKLELSFIPVSIPIKQRWRNNGLSADFLSDYVSTFFPVSDDEASKIAQEDIKSAVSFIANELLENVMKYTAEDCYQVCGISLYIEKEKLIFYATNFISEENAIEYQKFIEKLQASDPMDLYMEQLEYNATHDQSSGLGYLTMITDYQASLSWRFEYHRLRYIKAVCRVQINIQ